MNQEELEIELYSSLDEQETKQICTILEENGITYIRRDAGSGSYMNLYMGQSIQEKSIYVSRDDYDKALELISSFININVEEASVPELSEQIEEDDDGKKYKLIARVLGILVLGLPILIIIVSMFLPIIYNIML